MRQHGKKLWSYWVYRMDYAFAVWQIVPEPLDPLIRASACDDIWIKLVWSKEGQEGDMRLGDVRPWVSDLMLAEKIWRPIKKDDIPLVVLGEL